jgi:hypothetical protein
MKASWTTFGERPLVRYAQRETERVSRVAVVQRFECRLVVTRQSFEQIGVCRLIPHAMKVGAVTTVIVHKTDEAQVTKLFPKS